MIATATKRKTAKPEAPSKPRKPKDSKSVGEWFELMPTAEQRDKLHRIAGIATLCENLTWTLWRKHDPIRMKDIADAFRTKQQTGKWPKLPDPAAPANDCEGPIDARSIHAACFPELHSAIRDAIKNYVGARYLKNRWAYVVYRESLPTGDTPRIRFREKCVRIVADPANVDWFKVQLSLAADEDAMTIPFKSVGKSEFTFRWLRRLAETGEFPSGGTVSFKRRGGKRIWQICLSRKREAGEVNVVRGAVEGRMLVVYAPPEQDEFLKCQVAPIAGRPWVTTIESNDLIRTKLADERRRRHMGRNYGQSPHAASRSHGAERRFAGRYKFAARYENRVTDWIENRSAAIVAIATRSRCEGVHVERLSERDPSGLRLGSFPYYKLCQRIAQKAKEAGLKATEFSGFDAIKEMITSGDDNGCD